MKNQTNYIAHLKKSKWTRSALYFHLPLALLTALTLNHCSDSGGGGNGGISSGGPQPSAACGLAVSSSDFHGKGDGSTAAKPYVICDFAQLRKIKDGLAKHYALGKDIDASSQNWTPIGSKSSRFTGSLDGRAYEVQKLKITGTMSSALSIAALAFFSYTSSSAVIRNIGLTNVNLNTKYFSTTTLSSMAGLVGSNSGTIVNSYVTGKVVNTTTGGTPISTAGLVGKNEVGGRIENSYAMANVTGESTSTTVANSVSCWWFGCRE